jgi:hypothetical protein
MGEDQPSRACSATPGQPDRPGHAPPAVRQPPDAESETLNAGAPATDTDAHGKRVFSVASAAARLAGLADPDAYAEQVQAAFLPDVVTYQPGRPASFQPGGGNGRALDDNAFDIAVAALAGSMLGNASVPRPPAPEFPYLSAPIPAECRPSPTCSASASTDGVAQRRLAGPVCGTGRPGTAAFVILMADGVAGLAEYGSPFERGRRARFPRRATSCRPDPQSHIVCSSFLAQRAVTDGPDAGTQQQRPAHDGCGRRPGRDIMHPMFVQLFIETGPDDWPAEENRRRRARRSRRARPALAVRPSARDRQHRSRP